MTNKVPQVSSCSLVRCHMWKDKVQGTYSQPSQELLEFSHSPDTSMVTPGQPQLQQGAK